MSSPASITASVAASTYAPAAASGAAAITTSSSLLTEPVPNALQGADPLDMLAFFESRNQSLGVADGSQRIDDLEQQRHAAVQKQRDAVAQEVAAQKDHGFWDDLGNILGEVAKVAAVIASVAATVCTAGSAAPLAIAVVGAVLSAASFADGEFHVLQGLGVKSDVAGWIDTGMAIGGAVATAGAGMLSSAAQAGASAGMLSSADRARSLGVLVSQTVTVVSGVAQIGHGAAGIAAGQAEARADQDAADAVAAQARSDQATRWVQVVLDDTTDTDKKSKGILSTLSNIDAIQNDTAVAASTAVRG
ncbi:MAG TPA: hypothetical protein VGM06_18840 [Polyangiaceae bacterium]|jgi:hypothetical protein